MHTAPSTVVPRPESALPLDPGRVVRAVWDPSTWLAFIHLLLNLPLGILWFPLLVAGVALGLGLLITLLGIPVLVGTGWLVRALGHFERQRCSALLGLALRDPYRPVVEDTGWLARLAAIGKDPATWRDFVFLMLRLPVGIFTFTAVVTSWAIALGMLLSPFTFGLGLFRLDFFWWTFDGPIAAMIVTLGGVVMVIVATWITRGLAALERFLAGALLDASPEMLQQRVANLASSRARTMDAADQERRRLERDLHDGAQQRLVSLAMTLGLAQQKLATDPEQAAKLVTEAHEEAKRALQELRDLARGLHPAILADHGLESALPALAARCPIPTRVDATVSPRPTPAIESAAYFAVAEALTNVARHSQASSALVTARRHEDVLEIEVRDDGGGEARVVAGGGLAGLIDRVEALDGRLWVSSPKGGPTVIRMEMPCGS